MTKINDLVKFDGTNWYEYESDMMYFLMAKALWNTVEINPYHKEETDPTTKVSKSVVKVDLTHKDETWVKQNMQATGFIVSKVDHSIRETIRDEKTAFEIWETLKSLNQNKSAVVVARIRTEWESIDFKNEDSMISYLEVQHGTR